VRSSLSSIVVVVIRNRYRCGVNQVSKKRKIVNVIRCKSEMDSSGLLCLDRRNTPVAPIITFIIRLLGLIYASLLGGRLFGTRASVGSIALRDINLRRSLSGLRGCGLGNCQVHAGHVRRPINTPTFQLKHSDSLNPKKSLAAAKMKIAEASDLSIKNIQSGWRAASLCCLQVRLFNFIGCTE
jgi:hypothetical protein